MASTYTTNAGIELIGTGEQSGTWGNTTNTNLQIIDRLTNGVGAISLSGTTHTLTTTDGTLSDGQYSVLVFGGSPSGTNTVTISPNTAQHVYIVKNDSGESVVLTQGSGGNVTVADGNSAIVYSDGAGAGAAVVDITGSFGFQPLDAGLTSIAGLTTSADKMIYTTASDTYAVTDITSAGRALLDDADAAAQRTTLGIGTLATQASNNVTITGGSITGITDLAVSDGGTGASSFTANNVLLGNGTSSFQTVAPSTAGNVLTSNGTTWESTAPAGGGGGSYDFVASGAITNGDLVGLNANGTVQSISEPFGSPQVVNSGLSAHTRVTFDSNSSKFVISYEELSSVPSEGTSVVGTLSGSSLSLGTPVAFNPGARALYISSCFDSNSNKVVIAYRDAGNSNYGTAVVGTVSGTSISFGTPVVFESAAILETAITFDSNSNKVVVAYADNGNSNYGTAVVGTVSGTSISFGTPVVFENADSRFASAVFDSNSNRVVISYRDAGNSNRGTSIVGTVSGTSISFGSPVVYETTNIATAYSSMAFDSNSNKVVVFYPGASSYAEVAVGTVSGTSISFGTRVIIDSVAINYNSVVFDGTTNKLYFFYAVGSSSLRFASGEVSGTSINVLSSPETLDSGNIDYVSADIDGSSAGCVCSFVDVNNSNSATEISFDGAAYTPYNNWVGIAAEDISDTATGAVTILGGVNESQTGLTINSTYYFQDDATLGTTVVAGREVGKALSATKILITQGTVTI